MFDVKPVKKDEKIPGFGSFKGADNLDESSKSIVGKSSHGQVHKSLIGLKRSENGESSEDQSLKGIEGGFSGYPQGVYHHNQRFYNQQGFNTGDKDHSFLRPDGELNHHPKYRSMSTPQGFYYKQYQNYYPNPRGYPQPNPNPGTYVAPQSLPQLNPYSHPPTYSKVPPPPPDYQPGHYPSFAGTSPVPQYPGYNPRFQMKPYKKNLNPHNNYQGYNPYQNQQKRGMNKMEFQECLSQYFSKNEPSLDNFQNENKEEESSEVLSESLSSVNFEYGVGISPVIDQKKMKYQNNKGSARQFSKSVDLKQENGNFCIKQSVPNEIAFPVTSLVVNDGLQSELAIRPEANVSEVSLSETCVDNQKTKETETQCDLLNSLPICSLCKSDLNCVSSSNCHSNPSSGSNHSSQFSFEPNSSDSELQESLTSLSIKSSENPATTSLPYKRPASKSQLSPHKQHKFKDSASVDLSKDSTKMQKINTLSNHESAKLKQNFPFQSTLNAETSTLVDKNSLSSNQLSLEEDLKQKIDFCQSIENSPK